MVTRKTLHHVIALLVNSVCVKHVLIKKAWVASNGSRKHEPNTCSRNIRYWKSTMEDLAGEPWMCCKITRIIWRTTSKVWYRHLSFNTLYCFGNLFLLYIALIPPFSCSLFIPDISLFIYTVSSIHLHGKTPLQQDYHNSSTRQHGHNHFI